MKHKFLNTRGFTILELMIALTILSVILVMSSVILIQIGAFYVKGVNIANLQAANREVVSDISQSIQFGASKPVACTVPASKVNCYAGISPAGAPTVNSIYSYCVDNTRYSYVLDHELGFDPGDPNAVPPVASRTTPHVLWKDTMVSPNDPCLPMNIDLATPTSPLTAPSKGDGYELMPEHSRITRFLVEENSSYGTFNIAIWMAYGDSDLVRSNFAQAVPLLPTCRGGSGTQFCAVSGINTQVIRRLP